MKKYFKYINVFVIVISLFFICGCAKKYTVTYQADGGVFSDNTSSYEKNYKKGATIDLSNTPTKEGYTFVGWYCNETSAIIDVSTVVKSNITLVAKWEANTFTVTFDTNGGEMTDSKTLEVAYGTPVTKPADPTKEGYNFVGWMVNEQAYDFESQVKENIILVARWEAKQFTVTFDTNGGEMTDSKTLEVAYGTPVTKPADPTKEGYNFVGWMVNEQAYDFESQVKENITLVAKWEKIIFEVTYNTNGGTFTDGSTSKKDTYNQNETLVLPATPTKEGYTFQGWANQLTGEWIEEGLKVTTNLEIIAKWQEIVGYTITYQSKSGCFDDGTTEKQITIDIGAYLPYDFYPIIQDRYFAGWYDEATDELITPGTIPTKDMVVYAKYKRSSTSSNILFHENLSSETLPIELQYNEKIMYAFPIPKREGFQFLGWYDNPSFTGNAMFYQTEETTGNKEYWASWKLVDINYAKDIFDEIVPNVVDDNLNFFTNYCDTLIYWETSDYQLINNKGAVTKTHNYEAVTVKATITFDGQNVSYEKDVSIQPLEFKVLDRPVAGYFYGTGVTNMTDTFLENFDIAYYAFALVQPTGAVVMENINGLNKFLNDAKTLRKYGIRIVLSIAGGADNFSTACRTKGSSYVADNIMDLVVKYGFDGVDIDWEFPSDASDMQRMNALCNSLRIKLNALVKDEGTPYLLTAAIPSSELYSKFDLNTLNNYLDYVNMMSYDMNAAGLTTHLCPLLKANTDGNKGYGVDQGISYFTRAGLDKDKIIIGAAFYGKSYRVLGTTLNEKYPGLGVHAELFQIQYSSGTITYSYIARNILPNRKYVCYWDDKAKASYLYNETDQIFITFENEQSLIEKTIYAYDNNVGIMFWEYGYDYNNVLTDTICNKMHELKNDN